VRTGHAPILVTVQEQDGRSHLPGIKSPRGDVSKVVIHHPAQATVDGLPDDGMQPGPRAGQRGMIRRGEYAATGLVVTVLVILGRCQAALQHRASRGRGAQFPLAGGRQAGVPVQPVGIERGSPETQTTARTRSGSRAAQAMACGGPPECPMTAN
jgi:hypothetical protein